MLLGGSGSTNQKSFHCGYKSPTVLLGNEFISAYLNKSQLIFTLHPIFTSRKCKFQGLYNTFLTFSFRKWIGVHSPLCIRKVDQVEEQ